MRQKENPDEECDYEEVKKEEEEGEARARRVFFTPDEEIL